MQALYVVIQLGSLEYFAVFESPFKIYQLSLLDVVIVVYRPTVWLLRIYNYDNMLQRVNKSVLQDPALCIKLSIYTVNIQK